MGRSVEIDERTYQLLEAAAWGKGCTLGELVTLLLGDALPQPGTSTKGERERSESTGGVAVFADCEGHRTHGRFHPGTTRIDITSGPLGGQSFKTPSAAARAVVAHFKPGGKPNRNGWLFWRLDDGSRAPLNSIRRT